MNILEKIFNCEIEYTSCFCQVTKHQDFIRFQDDAIPDMYYHNYTCVINAENDAALVQFIESEIARNQNESKDFCLIRCYTPVGESIAGQLTHEPDISVSGHYMYDFAGHAEFVMPEDKRIVRVSNDGLLEEMLNLDLAHDEESLGIDFCTRRVYRRRDAYFSDGSLDAYICYYNGVAVGSCSLFIHGDIAKIEDFAVLPQYQRKGIGTAIIKNLIDVAWRNNVTVVYLETDEDDTAKEMYIKCGFYRVGDDITDLIFRF